MGRNLRMLRMGANMTQEELACRLGISTGLIPRWEAGAKGFSKSVVLKLCRIFDIRPCVFYLDDRSELVTSAYEKRVLRKLREAEKLGVDGLIVEHCEVIVDWAKRREEAASKDVFVGQQEVILVARKKPYVSGKKRSVSIPKVRVQKL